MNPTSLARPVAAVLLLLGGCTSYPPASRTPEEIARVRPDFDQCKEEANYPGAALTDVDSNGLFRWTGNDRVANECLKKCLAKKGRYIY